MTETSGSTNTLRSFGRWLWSRMWSTQNYWLTRFVILRMLGLVYFIAFLILVNQGLPLLGDNGLLPVRQFIHLYESHFASHWDAFWNYPTIFWFHYSDRLFMILAWVGLILSFLLIIGFANAISMLVLWFLYMSFVHVGQDWYGFGWDIQLLETGFLAVFLCPLLDPRPFPKSAPPLLIIWLFRWLTFRIMFGAGLIKLRNDPCWHKLTCLDYHFETQPVPNPFSRFMHFLPEWFHKFGALYNHLAEVVAPFFVFGPRTPRLLAGAVLLSFQMILIFSGNLAFLNWLTIVPILACFDDRLLKRILPKKIVRMAEKASGRTSITLPQKVVTLCLFAGIIWLSQGPVKNMLSKGQVMNTSFDQLDLVNAYGAFGTVGRKRYELVVEGTSDSIISDATRWKEYGFKVKPTDLYRTPPWISPYHYRLDWQIWFAAMSEPNRHQWLIHLVWKLLHNDKTALSLIRHNPFPDKPPRYIKINRYVYRFAPPGNKEGKVWNRQWTDSWLPPVSENNASLRRFLQQKGWLEK